MKKRVVGQSRKVMLLLMLLDIVMLKMPNHLLYYNVEIMCTYRLLYIVILHMMDIEYYTSLPYATMIDKC